MLNKHFGSKFNKDVKRMIKQGKDIEQLKTAITLLLNEEVLGEEYKLHPLEPKDKIPKRWEIHIGGRKSDWLLVYYYDKNSRTIFFERTGSHSDIFR